MSTQASTRRPAPDTGTRGRIVVGVDDTVLGSGPLLWACQEADRAHALLQVVSACPADVGLPATRPASYLGEDPTEAMQRSLTRLTQKLCADVEVLPPQVTSGTPPQVLVSAVDEHTLMLVVGRRTRAGLQRLLLGSTSIAVAARASVPVVVVPDSWVPARTASAPVVVGVTGDGDDEPALRFAFERAAALHVPLVAVHAWEIPPLLSWSPNEIIDGRKRVSAELDRRLEPWRTEFPDLEVVTAAPAERPVDAVIDAGRVGQLMVIGRHATASRHLGRLGSTARGVLHRAAVPVAVLPPSKTAHDKRPRTHVGSDVWAPTF